MKLLRGKLALVTGASGGLGSALAEGFAREGARVIVADVDRGKAEAVVNKIQDGGGEAFFEELDVRDVSRSWAQDVTHRIAPIDILVNNAGIALPGRLDQSGAPEVWDRILGVNRRRRFSFFVISTVKHSRQPWICSKTNSFW